MEFVQKAVRDYLRAADIVIDLLKANGDLSDQEVTMLQAYNTRMQSFLVLREIKQVGATKNGPY
jgi:hypothetical protein